MSPWASAMSNVELVDEYAVFCAGVQQICKVDLAQYKRRQMERRVRSFAERNGTPRLSRYLAVLAADERERERFLERVTINVSQLWRNPEQWEMLAGHVIPELAQRDRIRAWSAGCSYGAEAYTLAAICLDVAPDITLEILGSDIDERMIESAREAHFSESDARSAPAGTLARWFEPAPNGWRAGSQLRNAARFEVGDLLVVEPPQRAYDFIACRNTVIYFTAEGRSAVHAKLADALRPGGYLMVGCTERIADPDDHGLTLALPFIYRKSS
jgi:chemotaxis protein methyltransferase CheR